MDKSKETKEGGRKMKNKLCSNCKTGRDTYRLDPKSVMCPFIGSNNGKSCVFFKPMKEESEGNTDERV